MIKKIALTYTLMPSLHFKTEFLITYLLSDVYLPVIYCFTFLKKDIGEFFIRKELCGFKIRFILKISYPHP